MNKMCPFGSVNENQPIVLKNIDAPSEDFISELRRGGVLQIMTGDDFPPSIEPLHGRCVEEACAWWSEDAQKCAIVVIAESQRKAAKAK